jgi:hypothetical protein
MTSWSKPEEEIVLAEVTGKDFLSLSPAFWKRQKRQKKSQS